MAAGIPWLVVTFISIHVAAFSAAPPPPIIQEQIPPLKAFKVITPAKTLFRDEVTFTVSGD